MTDETPYVKEFISAASDSNKMKTLIVSESACGIGKLAVSNNSDFPEKTNVNATSSESKEDFSESYKIHGNVDEDITKNGVKQNEVESKHVMVDKCEDIGEEVMANSSMNESQETDSASKYKSSDLETFDEDDTIPESNATDDGVFNAVTESRASGGDEVDTIHVASTEENNSQVDAIEEAVETSRVTDETDVSKTHVGEEASTEENKSEVDAIQEAVESSEVTDETEISNETHDGKNEVDMGQEASVTGEDEVSLNEEPREDSQESFIGGELYGCESDQNMDITDEQGENKGNNQDEGDNEGNSQDDAFESKYEGNDLMDDIDIEEDTFTQSLNNVDNDDEKPYKLINSTKTGPPESIDTSEPNDVVHKNECPEAVKIENHDGNDLNDSVMEKDNKESLEAGDGREIPLQAAQKSSKPPADIEKLKNENDVTNQLPKLDGNISGVETRGACTRKRTTEDDVSSNMVAKKLRCENPGPSSDVSQYEKDSTNALVDTDDEDADDPEPMETDLPTETSSPAIDSCNLPKRNTRSSSTASESPSISEEIATLTDNHINAVRKVLLRGTYDNFSIKDLEELLTQKICEALSERWPSFGELRRRNQYLEEIAEKFQGIAAACKKQIREQETVMQKYLEDVKCNTTSVVAPIRVTRSVGLQVSLGNKKLIGTNNSTPTTTVTKAPTKTNVVSPVKQQTPKVVTPNGQIQPIRPPKVVHTPVLRPVRPPVRTLVPVNAVRAKAPTRMMAISPRPPNGKILTFRAVRPAVPRPASNSVIDLTDECSSPISVPGNIVVRGPPLTFVMPSGHRPPNQPKFVIAPPTTAVIRPSRPQFQHPAPLPLEPAPANNASWKRKPPQPALKITNTTAGIVLSWDMELTPDIADIKGYQLYAYQEGTAPPNSSLWRQVGEVAALALPMACTLSAFVPGHRYHFSVRAIDVHSRVGPFSYPGSILLKK